ncbi:hypothetical protein WMY93_032504 [Mugilogobius chulae]|uniref:Uncharacterized protein n=1 Tax=Mugilogobius chulae TaxID=88201 RepID=A0AAW0MRA6_9GOBI
MKGVITSTYGRILKMDSTKKITKKLAGDVGETATWMTNVTNEYGQVLNSVSGIVKRYQDAKEPEPEVIYVDRDCCNEAGVCPQSFIFFRPWKSIVRLDIFHFMRRFSAGLTTEHHRLYGIFCSRLSSCIFEVDQRDLMELKEAKKCEMMMKYLDHTPSESQVMSSITSSEESRHCRKRTRGIEQTRQLIDKMLQSLWDSTDTMGLPLINHENMTKVWAVQQNTWNASRIRLVWTYIPSLTLGCKKEKSCLMSTGVQEGPHLLKVSIITNAALFQVPVEKHAMHTQMYMLEGGSRWNLNRACDAVSMGGTSKQKYERIAVAYLLHQTGRGDMQAPQHHSELGSILPDIDEDWAEDSLSPASVQATDMPHPHNEIATCDSRGVPGWEAVDKLAEYLVSSIGLLLLYLLLRQMTLGVCTLICSQWTRLSVNTLRSVRRGTCLDPGGTRATECSAPGQQAAERLFMVHGQAAHKPDITRISECVALKLLKEYQPARNRPKDVKGKTLPLTQAIVQTYSHIKQLLEDNQLILQQTNLVLVTVNNTTVSSW